MDVTGAPKEGEIFAAKYRVERVLGAGGMGFVIAATHLQLHERVAIKLLLPELTRDAETVERFLREGRAAVKIRSEHVVRVLDVGELEDRTPYLVMEYLAGADFSEVVRRRGRLTVAAAVDYVLEACEAIAEAHALKMVHRDLKPSNLFLSTRPNGSECVKVLDFGISKMASAEGAGLAMTKTSTMMGSPLYMSPEQLKSSRSVDERADIWAIGIILYELISGKPPFLADSLAELGALVLSGEPPWLADAVPEVPSELAAIVNTCLRKNRDERFQTLSGLAAAIAKFGTGAARHSADRIIGTLGPPTAAMLAATARIAAPLPGSGGLPRLGASSSAGHAVTVAAEATHRGRRWPYIALAMLAAIGIPLLVTSALKRLDRKHATEVPAGPSAVSLATDLPASAAMPSDSGTSRVPEPLTSAATPPAKTHPSSVTSAATRSAAAGARTTARPHPPIPPSTPPTATTANPTGIATSSKD